jgi:hypothetical protein
MGFRHVCDWRQIGVVVAAIAGWVGEVVMGMGFQWLCGWRLIKTRFGELQYFFLFFFFIYFL